MSVGRYIEKMHMENTWGTVSMSAESRPRHRLETPSCKAFQRAYILHVKVGFGWCRQQGAHESGCRLAAKRMLTVQAKQSLPSNGP